MLGRGNLRSVVGKGLELTRNRLVGHGLGSAKQLSSGAPLSTHADRDGLANVRFAPKWSFKRKASTIHVRCRRSSGMLLLAPISRGRGGSRRENLFDRKRRGTYFGSET